MSEITVANLAEIVGTPVDKLLEQLQSAGIALSGPEEMVSDEQKKQLLTFLKQSHGAKETNEPKRITLKRSVKSSLKVTGSSGKAKTVSVEVRKKRTYVKGGKIAAAEVEPETKPAVAPVVDAPVAVETVEAPVLDEAAQKAAIEAAAQAEAAKEAERLAQEKAELTAKLTQQAEALTRAEVESRLLEK